MSQRSGDPDSSGNNQSHTNIPLDSIERKPLELTKGQSKTAKLARALLALDFSEPSPQMLQADLLQLQARLHRAQRWQAANLKN